MCLFVCILCAQQFCEKMIVKKLQHFIFNDVRVINLVLDFELGRAQKKNINIAKKLGATFIRGFYYGLVNQKYWRSKYTRLVTCCKTVGVATMATTTTTTTTTTTLIRIRFSPTASLRCGCCHWRSH